MKPTIATPTDDLVADMLIQPDGKIVVVGRIYSSALSCHIGLVRYLSNGVRDSSFGSGGAAFVPLRNCATMTNREVYAVALQADGKLVVAAGDYNGINYDLFLVRLNSNGTRDSNFGTLGYVRTAIGNGDEWAQRVVIQDDGKIVVAGKTHLDDGPAAVVMRYQSNGMVDTTFGTSGVTLIRDPHIAVSGLQLQADGKAVVALHRPGTIRLFRLLVNGQLDETFNETGKAYYTTFRAGGSQAMGIQPDGKIVVSGVKQMSNNGVSTFRAGVARLMADGNLQIGTSPYVTTLGVSKLWQERPDLQGNGVTIAVVDSGIIRQRELQDPNGATRVKAAIDFTDDGDGVDRYGHGTHVAGIIGGNGTTTNGQRIGIAPQVNLINVKVSNEQGMSYMSDVLTSLQWIYDNKDTYNIRVVNLSLNSTVAESYHVSPLCAAAEILWFNGMVVVVAAGNNGTGTGPVDLLPPANDPFVITVGAADSMGTIDLVNDQVADFSAYGRSIDGHAKPDLVAPGRSIVSLLGNRSAWVYRNYTAHRLQNPYFRMSGTSMATPMVSGAVALLLQNEPNLNPDQVKFRLKATANKNWSGYTTAKAGAGYLDVYAAVNGTTTRSANTNLAISQMLFSGANPVTWGSVSWNSVSWNSVSWNSVSWNSVSWNSVSWNANSEAAIWEQEPDGVDAALLLDELTPPAPLPDNVPTDLPVLIDLPTEQPIELVLSPEMDALQESSIVQRLYMPLVLR